MPIELVISLGMRPSAPGGVCAEAVGGIVANVDRQAARNTIEWPDTVKLADPQTLQLAPTGTVTYRLKPNSLVVLRFEGATSE